MTNQICPFIGLQDDRETALGFPADPNTCFKAHPPTRVKLEYQKDYCLSPKHSACVVFLASSPISLPAEISAPAAAKPFSIRSRYLLIGIVLVVLIASGVWLVFGAKPSTPLLIPQTGGEEVSATPNRSPFVIQGFSEATLPPNETATRLSCPPPSGWKAYIVLPTDTFTWLSRVFRISSEDLRAANCLAEDDLLRPGDVIYVPGNATSTPEPSGTPAGQNNAPNTGVNLPVVKPPTATETPAPVDEPAPTAIPPSPTKETPPTSIPSPTNTLAPTDSPTPTDTLAPPTDPPPTSGPSPITISDSNWSGSVNCEGAEVTVTGNHNSISLTGTCSSLTVTGNNNDISLENPTSVSDQGNGNSIG